MRAWRRRCEQEKLEARRGALREAARRLMQLADLLRERGCYDVEPRARLEAEALAGDADPGELAYYRCLIQCLRGACRIEDCMAQLGYPPRRTAAHGRREKQPPEAGPEEG